MHVRPWWIATGLMFLPTCVQGQQIERLLDSAGSTTASLPTAEASKTPTLTGPELRSAVQKALREVDQRLVAKNQIDGTLAGKLVQLHDELKYDASLPLEDRQHMRKTIRDMLARVLARMRQPVRPDAPPVVLAQVLPPAAAGTTGAINAPPADYSTQLIEIIQDTLAPESWDTRGGQGTVRYWKPGHALIVRQTSGVHGALQQLLNDLR